jgi:putative flippase GtrA
MLSSLIGLIINVSIMYFLIEGFDWYYNFAKLVAILVALIWNYGSAKTLIFRNKKK